MTNFGGTNYTSSTQSRAHLAVINGGKSVSADAPVTATDALSMRSVTTNYVSSRTDIEGARSRTELGVRSVARAYENFDDALLPMIHASGVKGESAAIVVEAIRKNPTLRAQAERAFQRARIDVV